MSGIPAEKLRISDWTIAAEADARPRSIPGFMRPPKLAH
jgi:hypothetical protein